MNNAARWFFGLAAGSLLGIGCAQDVTRPPARGPGSGVVLKTELGPMDLVSFRDDGEGFRHLRVHAVLGGGRHVVREIVVRGRAVPGEDGMEEFSAAVLARGVTTYRSVRRVDEEVPGRIAARVESGHDLLDIRLEPVPGGVRLVVVREGEGLAPRRVDRILESDRLRDPAYAVRVRAELAALYPAGPLVDHPDKELLEAVLGSPDWDAVLERRDDAAGAVGGATDPAVSDPDYDRRVRRVCAAASAVSLVSCKVAPFIPAAWFACVPATGISVACLANQIRQAFGNDMEGSCPCPCMCNENPPVPEPPTPPVPPTEP